MTDSDDGEHDTAVDVGISRFQDVESIAGTADGVSLDPVVGSGWDLSVEFGGRAIGNGETERGRPVGAVDDSLVVNKIA